MWDLMMCFSLVSCWTRFSFTQIQISHPCPRFLQNPRIGGGCHTMHSTVPFCFLEYHQLGLLSSETVVSLCLCCSQGDSVYTLPAWGLSRSPGVASQLPDHDLWHHWHAYGKCLLARRGNGCSWSHAALPQVFTSWWQTQTMVWRIITTTTPTVL